MKRLFMLLSILMLVGVLAACNNGQGQTITETEEPQDDIQMNDEVDPIEDTPAASNNEQEQEVVDSEAEVASNDEELIELDIVSLKETIELGMTTTEIMNMLGDQYQEVAAMDDGSPMWRYDLGTTEDYQSPDDEYDTVDIDGMNEDLIEGQAFIYWDAEEKVNSFSMYYKDHDGKISHYIIFPDGQKKEESIG